jgi:hypothetical protein
MMSFLVADAHFLRGVVAGLAVATALSCAGMIFAVLAVPSPPAVMTVTFQSP